jgi:hypothetical protein
MPDPLANPDPQPPPKAGLPDLDLDVLRTRGKATLRSNGFKTILKITLQLYASAWDNECCDTVMRRASDIFRSPASKGCAAQPGPPGSHLVWAVLKFHFRDCPGQHSVELRPPNILKFQHPADAPLILAWLAKSPLRVARKIPHAIVIIILGATMAYGAILTDDDDDGGDDDPRVHLHQKQ